jgi:hypothetical protein
MKRSFGVLVTLTLPWIIIGCTACSNHLPASGKTAARCAENWRKQGFDFDPSTMTCSDMFTLAQAIRRAAYWQERGYTFDANSLTAEAMDRKATKLPEPVNKNNGGQGSASYSTVQQRDPTRSSEPSQQSTYSVPPVAGSGSYYGEISENTGRPKTVYVHPYYRKDGTYVRSHYRSSPRR